MKSKHFFFFLVIFSTILIGCEEDYTPKPNAYPKINFPQKHYQNFDNDCPFKFEYPIYSIIQKKAAQKEIDNCWRNIAFPSYKATIYLTYLEIEENLRDHTEQSRKLVFDHISKASDIKEEPIYDTINDKYGMLYDLKGEVASSVQFYFSDSSENFLRGSLYFYSRPNEDSLRPIIDFIKTDIDHFIETFEWK